MTKHLQWQLSTAAAPAHLSQLQVELLLASQRPRSRSCLQQLCGAAQLILHLAQLLQQPTMLRHMLLGAATQYNNSD